MNDIIFKVLERQLGELGIHPGDLATPQMNQYLRDTELAVLLHTEIYGDVTRLLKK